MRAKIDSNGDPRGRRGGAVKKVVGRRVIAGREIWDVTSDSGPHRLVTSATSVIAMDQAVRLYKRALRRLANR
jgi:hypothetical protein